MSIFKTNKFFRVIKHFILALPLMFVLGTSLYAIVNPNAKDSYYGETINEELTETITLNNYSFNVYYTLYTNTIETPLTPGSSVFISAHNIIRNGIEYNEYNTITLSRESTGSQRYILGLRGDNVTSLYYNFGDTDFIVSFYIDNLGQYDFPVSVNYVSYNQYSYLNNAFEYGLYQFTNIGFGQFDFVGLFNGIFTTNINNVYASFINDYINYYLFVEIIYFAPWVFHAFIHFAYDLGDYFTSSFKRNRKDDD